MPLKASGYHNYGTPCRCDYGVLYLVSNY